MAVPALHHFSDRFDVERFVPRPARTPARRKTRQEWLNGPLVWAIDAAHRHLDLFPRECPRIVAWPVAISTARDAARLLDGSDARAVAFVEEDWLERIATARLCRYDLPPDRFMDLRDAGMRVSEHPVTPIGSIAVDDLLRGLRECGVELRTVRHLHGLRSRWDTSVHVSGIRLRNAHGG